MLDGSNALHLLADRDVSGAASVKSVLASAKLLIAAGALTTDKDDRGRTPGDVWGARFERRFQLSEKSYKKIHGLLLKVAKVLGKPGAGGLDECLRGGACWAVNGHDACTPLDRTSWFWTPRRGVGV
jgi:hypothetical protein